MRPEASFRVGSYKPYKSIGHKTLIELAVVFPLLGNALSWLFFMESMMVVFFTLER